MAAGAELFRHGRGATVTVPEAIPLELWRRRGAGWFTPPRGTRERGPRPPAGRCREDHRVPVPRRPAREAPRPPTAAADPTLTPVVVCETLNAVYCEVQENGLGEAEEFSPAPAAGKQAA